MKIFLCFILVFFNACFVNAQLFYDEPKPRLYKIKDYQRAAENAIGGHISMIEGMGDVNLKRLEMAVGVYISRECADSEIVNRNNEMMLKRMTRDYLPLYLNGCSCYEIAMTFAGTTYEKKRIADKLLCIARYGHLANGHILLIQEKEHSKCIDYYKFAAENGSPEAAYILSNYYLFNKKWDLGLHFLNIAAEGGDFEAQMQLGECNFDGRYGVEKNQGKAFHYFMIAGLNNNEKKVRYNVKVNKDGVMGKIAYCYRLGVGTDKNEKMADYWDVLAALYGDQSVQGVLINKGIAVESSFLSIIKYFQPVLNKASESNVASKILYNAALLYGDNPNERLASLVDLAFIGDDKNLTAVEKDFVYEVLAVNYKVLNATNDASYWSNMYASKRKDLKISKSQRDTWILRTIRLAMAFSEFEVK